MTSVPAGLRPLLVGFGHAGRDLHLRSLRRMLGDVEIGVIDPRPGARTGGAATHSAPTHSAPTHSAPAQGALTDDALTYGALTHGATTHGDTTHGDTTYGVTGQGDGPLRWYQDLGEAVAGDPGRWVVHICTPPALHLPILRLAAQLGYRYCIVEKPMAPSLAEARSAAQVCQGNQVKLLVLANWLSSALTDQLVQLIGAGAPPVAAVLRQSKPRISRSLTDRGHRTALEAEMPHLVALAAHLFGPRPQVVSARMWDLRVGGRRIPSMGGVRAELVTAAGVRLQLESDLMSPVIHRSARVELDDGTVAHGYYPPDSRDLFSQLFRYDAQGRQLARDFFADDVVYQFFQAAYSWFAGDGPRPASTPALHLDVCATLHDIEEAVQAVPAGMGEVCE